MTKNEMNYDEQQHQVVRGRDDIKVGDKVLAKPEGIVRTCIVKFLRSGILFNKYYITCDSYGDQMYFKKYRWQLFKINN